MHEERDREYRKVITTYMKKILKYRPTLAFDKMDDVQVFSGGHKYCSKVIGLSRPYILEITKFNGLASGGFEETGSHFENITIVGESKKKRKVKPKYRLAAAKYHRNGVCKRCSC